MVLPQSRCPYGGPGGDPREAPRFRSQEGMFQQFFPGDVMETPTHYTHVDENLVENLERKDERGNRQNMDKF